MHKREMEWSEVPGPHRFLVVRSCDGRFSAQAMILDDVFAKIKGVVAASVVTAPLITGTEFPLGCAVAGAPFDLEGGFEIAAYGIIHTEFVRSLVERWGHRRRYRRRRSATM